MTTLLTPIAANPRTKHTARADVMSAMLLLAPAMESGKNLCPFASRGCADACLYYSGRGAMSNTQQARINRTRWFLDDRDGFMEQIVKEIESLITRSWKQDCNAGTLSNVAVRLNGTSDILWERIPVVYRGSEYGNIMQAFGAVQFYDYTKIPGRSELPNYHLTFSLSECNDAHAIAELERGRNVAVVMRYHELPETWSGYPVVYGDEYDYRFLDPTGGNIIALKANGRAIKDTTGFVRSVNDVLDPTRRFVPFTASKRDTVPAIPDIAQLPLAVV
jgi:hypothetical protein